MPTIDIIFSRLRELNDGDVLQFNIFKESILPANNAPIWPWRRYMQSIGFIYGDRISPYVHKKNRDDIVLMRKNYLKWKKQYREND